MQPNVAFARQWIALAAFAFLTITAFSQALHWHGGGTSDDRWHASCVRCQTAPQTVAQGGLAPCLPPDPSEIATAWVAEVPQVSPDTDLAAHGIRGPPSRA
jgi:hypothetical protein